MNIAQALHLSMEKKGGGDWWYYRSAPCPMLLFRTVFFKVLYEQALSIWRLMAGRFAVEMFREYRVMLK